jgi:glycosyltransferase involved in cell wall biosynthesis
MSLKISVITPSFEQAQFLPATMASIHDQHYPNLEHIVIDGGSTDGSAEIIKSYEKELAYWISEPDEGQTDALIRGFERSTGDIQCWLNSDDLFEPRTLREVARYFEEHPEVEFVYGNSTWIDRAGEMIKAQREHAFNRFIWIHDHNFIPQPSTFWRRSLYERVGGLDPLFDLAMDADLWIRFADQTRPHHLRRNWSRMRFYAEQKNTRFRPATLKEVETIRSRYLQPRSKQTNQLKSIAARSMRVGWKLLTSCYSVQEIKLHVNGLRSSGWEEERLNV